MVRFDGNKLKVQLKLAVNRLKMLQAKKRSISQNQRKEIATLLEAGKVESARIRVEHIIREDYNTEAMEVLELLCELILARIGLLSSSSSMATMDPSLMEAVHTIIYSASRCEGAKELLTVRELLCSKFGQQLGDQALHNRQGLVNTRVFQRLSINAPDQTLVTLYLTEIAKTYNVQFDPDNRQGTETLLDHSVTAPDTFEVAAAQTFQTTQQHKPSIPSLPGTGGASISSPVVQQTLSPQESLPSPPKDFESTSNTVGSPDFDSLAQRFEELKRKK